VWTSGVGTVGFGYDASGRRVRKTLGTTTTRYIWDGNNLLAEVDGAAPATPLAEYTSYPGVDQLHSLRRRMRSDSVFYYAQDFPGNVVGVINGSSALVNQYRYEPGGVDMPGFPQGSVPNTLRFAARQLDSETGLYYMRARYYDPSLERFVSEDPIGLAGGPNAYVYTGNNPVNGTDPNGLCASASDRILSQRYYVNDNNDLWAAQHCVREDGSQYPWWEWASFNIQPVVVNGRPSISLADYNPVGFSLEALFSLWRSIAFAAHGVTSQRPRDAGELGPFQFCTLGYPCDEQAKVMARHIGENEGGGCLGESLEKSAKESVAGVAIGVVAGGAWGAWRGS